MNGSGDGKSAENKKVYDRKARQPSKLLANQRPRAHREKRIVEVRHYNKLCSQASQRVQLFEVFCLRLHIQ
jgi:hypothetical protein